MAYPSNPYEGPFGIQPPKGQAKGGGAFYGDLPAASGGATYGNARGGAFYGDLPKSVGGATYGEGRDYSYRGSYDPAAMNPGVARGVDYGGSGAGGGGGGGSPLAAALDENPAPPRWAPPHDADRAAMLRMQQQSPEWGGWQGALAGALAGGGGGVGGGGAAYPQPAPLAPQPLSGGYLPPFEPPPGWADDQDRSALDMLLSRMAPME